MKKGPAYKIKYYYKTGNSFGSEDCEAVLEFEWYDYKKAEQALKRIEEHYRWYDSDEYPFRKPVKRPDWHTGNLDKSIIKLKMDNDKEVQFWCPWCGYFERLYSAEIIIDTYKITL